MPSKNVRLALTVVFTSIATMCWAQDREPDPIPIPDSVYKLIEAAKQIVDENVSLSDPPTAPSQRMILEEPLARVEFALAQRVITRSRKNIFQTVGLLPFQTVRVIVSYPLAMAGRLVRAEPLDGGKLFVVSQKEPDPAALVPATEFIVESDGTITFSFQADSLKPGLYQVRLSSGNQEWGLPFYVLDRLNPQNNPPVLSPAPEPTPPAVPTPPPTPKPSLPPLPDPPPTIGPSIPPPISPVARP